MAAMTRYGTDRGNSSTEEIRWDHALIHMVLADTRERLKDIEAELRLVPTQIASLEDGRRLERLATQVHGLVTRIPEVERAIHVDLRPTG